MSVPSIEELERHLSALPREAWERPDPPPPPWPADPARRRIAAGRKPAAVPVPARPRRPRRPALVLRPLAAAALSLALVAAGVGTGLLLRSGGDGRGPGGPADGTVTVRLEPLGSGGRTAAGAVTLSGGAGGRASVRLSGLAPSSRGDFYELWLLGDGGELVSLGSVRVPRSGRAELRVRLPVDPARFRFLDVSREPADGDPGHSADSVLRGPAT
jgi:Anti-sigma-K factor rskA